MNPNQIAFITCVNDWSEYEEMKRYIERLDVPEGMVLEFHPIENATSMTEGYNRGMNQSNAKYKVYLHQDVLILHRGFLRDVLGLFQRYPQIGLMGVIGVRTLPSNGIWWESKDTVGKVFDSHAGYMALLDLGEAEGEYAPVQAVDGLIMITQYDVPWREDLFTGWHFYDASQCMEFLRAGYEVAVPAQSQPWCMHDCGVVNTQNGFEEYRQVFLQQYVCTQMDTQRKYR